MSQTLTYHDVVCEHYRLKISYEQTLGIIKALFPGSITEAISLWNQLQTQTAYGANHNG